MVGQLQALLRTLLAICDQRKSMISKPGVKTVAQQPPAPEQSKRNRWVALSIMLLPALVLVCASLLWLAVKHGYVDIVGSLGTHNNGTLLQPVREFESIAVLDSHSQPFHYLQQAPKWTLLIPGTAQCEESCKQTLWLTRQLRAALGRRALHLRRFYLSNSWPLAPEFSNYLAAEHPELTVLHGDSDAINRLLASPGAGSALPADSYYLIDKRGFVMMQYGPQQSGKEVISDLKFLMKQVGDE